MDGHQDRHTRVEDLPYEAVLNIDTDKRAKKLMQETEAETSPQYLPLEDNWQVSIQGKQIVSKLHEELYDTISYHRIIKYYEAHGQLSKQTAELIDWENIGKAMKRLPQARQHWVTKFNTNTCAVGVTMKKWKKRSMDNCPHCDQENEDNMHVLQCQSPKAVEVWDTAIRDLTTYLQQKKVRDKVSHAIIRHMRAWRDNDEVQKFHYEPYLQEAITEQNLIGWNNFMLGRIGRKWAIVLRRMYNNSRTTISMMLWYL